MSASLAGVPQRYLRTPEAARFVGLSIRTLEKHGSAEPDLAIQSSAAASSTASRTGRPGWIVARRRLPPSLASARCCWPSAIALAPDTCVLRRHTSLLPPEPSLDVDRFLVSRRARSILRSGTSQRSATMTNTINPMRAKPAAARAMPAP